MKRPVFRVYPSSLQLMEEPFDLPVSYKGEELLFPAQVHQYGYTHRFAVQVNGAEVLFEPDEERRYRAVVDTSLPESSKKVHTELLKAIAQSLEDLLK